MVRDLLRGWFWIYVHNPLRSALVFLVSLAMYFAVVHFGLSVI